jgi:MFS family permease
VWYAFSISIVHFDTHLHVICPPASSFAALFSAFFYSVWYTRFSFRSALIFSAICALVGNLLYACAITYKSMKLALFGRVLCGFGSAEVANRQLISDCVSVQSMTRACAFFVTASALGMSIGPLIAGEVVLIDS